MKDLEFLPQHHLSVRRNIRLRSVRMLLLTTIVVGMACWTSLTNRAIVGVQVELDGVLAETSQLSGEITRLEQLEKAQKALQERQALVVRLNPLRPRSDVVCDLAQRLPAEIVLTRLEIEMQRQTVQDKSTAASRRRGAKAESQVQTTDRLGIEGFAADDLALARFLQEMTEPRASGVDGTTVTLFKRGDLSFTRDAQYREKSVRVFRATFHAADGEATTTFAGLTQGRK